MPASWLPDQGDTGIKSVRLHGHKVCYRKAGAGPAIVLIHGVTSSSENWDRVIELLAEEFTVVAPDLIGHGESAKPRGDYSMGAYASGVRDLMLALDIDTATFVGHSLGGGVAMQLAYQFPERCERLVLVSQDVPWGRALASCGARGGGAAPQDVPADRRSRLRRARRRWPLRRTSRARALASCGVSGGGGHFAGRPGPPQDVGAEPGALPPLRHAYAAGAAAPHDVPRRGSRHRAASAADVATSQDVPRPRATASCGVSGGCGHVAGRPEPRRTWVLEPGALPPLRHTADAAGGAAAHDARTSAGRPSPARRQCTPQRAQEN